MTYHDGEIAVQTRAGVRAEAEQLCSLIGAELKPSAIAFLQSQTLAISSTIAPGGSLWASLLTGDPGFIQVLDQQTIELNALAVSSDPMHQNIAHQSQIGLLVIDLANRKRLRVNGRAALSATGLRVTVQQTFFNCPKYIQTRHLERSVEQVPAAISEQREQLSQRDRAWIKNADTFFIATAHTEQGCDVSHRGGNPGFIQVIDDQKIVFPDYAGNNMFQTFGNLSLNPNAGLLFIDFEQGHTLQLSGQATLIWDEERCQQFASAERVVEFAIEQILETCHATPFRWKFGTFSPANP